ncbi:MAG TPA: hemolysin family protein [Nocardioidaceae bacterium]|jgi:CBS domain containing-hemolysin-like protein|nr:hemolysin family protein [Actinomycetota bacterium]HEV8056120.1 hemolysin family protein [Nocardioidaceae bacterium]
MMRDNGWLLAIATSLIVVAGLFASAEAALSSVSKVRVAELVEEGRSGAGRLRAMIADPPRFLNTALLLRLAAETAAVVLVTIVVTEYVDLRWAELLIAIGAMLVVSYVVIGVAPRTLGRQHSERVALLSAGPLTLLTRVLGPLPHLLILLGNALTPGKGFAEGPFATEAELRELVDLAEQSAVIESGERRMIHQIFELGDTLVREVMVPRTDMVFIERHKTLRQMMSLALRSGFSRIPVVGDNLDDIIGIVYLKDVTKRVFDRHAAETTEQVESVLRPALFVPDSKPVDELLQVMQSERMHVAVVVDEYGGTGGLITIEDVLEQIVGEITDEYDVESPEVEELAAGTVRVSSRLSVTDLGNLFGVALDDDDVESVGGLMAKHLGRVPIPGAEVDVEGLHLVAEAPTGRRNRLGTLIVSRVESGGGGAELDRDRSSTAAESSTG